MAGRFRYALLASATLLAIGTAAPSPFDVQLSTLPARGENAADTREAIIRGLHGAALTGRDVNYKSQHQLDYNWQNVTLVKIGGDFEGSSQAINNDTTGSVKLDGTVELQCKNCYLSTLASAEVNIQSSSADFGTTLNTTIKKVESQVNETVVETWHALETYFKNTSNWDDYAISVWNNIKEDNEFELTDLLPPNVNVSSFDDDLKATLPDTTITFRFDDLDLYLELETILQASATYTVKLIPPGGNPLGIALPNNINLGVIFSADLIFSIEGELDITGGLHIKVDDHVAMQLALFGDEVSDMTLEGGHFELLPVTVRSATATFTAMLRLGAQAALTVGNLIPLSDDIPDTIKAAQVGNVSLSELVLAGGILMGVNADVAVFKTSFETIPADPECEFKIIQDYSLVLGATAGAQVTVGTVTYGPAVAKTTPVYTTTLKSYCVGGAASSAPMVTSAAATTATSAAHHKKRDAPTSTPAVTGSYSTTLSTTRIQTIVQCPASVLGDCPVSLQTTVKQIDSMTTTIYANTKSQLPSQYPASSTTATAAITRVPLGANAQKLAAISGSPSTYTYTPTPTPTSSPDPHATSNIILDAIEAAEKEAEEHNERTTGLAVGIGVGIPCLLILGALVFCGSRRKIIRLHRPYQPLAGHSPKPGYDATMGTGLAQISALKAPSKVHEGPRVTERLMEDEQDEQVLYDRDARDGPHSPRRD